VAKRTAQMSCSTSSSSSFTARQRHGQVGVDGERAAEGLKGGALVAHLLVQHAETGQRGEVPRLELEHLFGVGERALELAAEVIGRGAPVPHLGELRFELDGSGQDGDGDAVLVLLHRPFGLLHQQIDGRAARAHPGPPHRLFDGLGGGLVLGLMELAEQPVDHLGRRLARRAAARLLGERGRAGDQRGEEGGQEDAGGRSHRA
jgi:hypothetical protein